MNNLAIHFSSEKEDWETPRALYDAICKRFDIALDVAASDKNHKSKNYFTHENDALQQDWRLDNGKYYFLNPPYGRTMKHWARHGLEQAKNGARGIWLVPARTDSLWWYTLAEFATHTFFIRGRLNFEVNGEPMRGKDGRPMPAPFPSAIILTGRPDERTGKHSFIEKGGFIL